MTRPNLIQATMGLPARELAVSQIAKGASGIEHGNTFARSQIVIFKSAESGHFRVPTRPGYDELVEHH